MLTRGEVEANMTPMMTPIDLRGLTESPKHYSEWVEVQYLVSNLTKSSCRPVDSVWNGFRARTGVARSLSPIHSNQYLGNNRNNRPSTASPNGITVSSSRWTTGKDKTHRPVSAYALVQKQDREASLFDYQAEALRPMSTVTTPLSRPTDEIVSATVTTHAVEAPRTCWERLHDQYLEGKHRAVNPDKMKELTGDREGTTHRRPLTRRGADGRDKVLLTQKNVVLHKPVSSSNTLERRQQKGLEEVNASNEKKQPNDSIAAYSAATMKDLVAHRKNVRYQSRCRYEGEQLQRWSERRIAAARHRQDLYFSVRRVRKNNRERIANIWSCREGRKSTNGLDDGTAVLKKRMRAMETGMILPSGEEETDNGIAFD